MDCHCEPGKNGNPCQKHWALAQVKGSCTLWNVQSLRLDWRKNSKPNQAVFTLMDVVVSSYWEAEGQNCRAVWCSGPEDAQVKEAVGGHKNPSCTTPSASSATKNKDSTFLISAQPKLQCVNEGSSPSEAQLGSRDLARTANQNLSLVNNSDIIQCLLCKAKPVSAETVSCLLQWKTAYVFYPPLLFTIEILTMNFSS